MTIKLRRVKRCFICAKLNNESEVPVKYVIPIGLVKRSFCKYHGEKLFSIKDTGQRVWLYLKFFWNIINNPLYTHYVFNLVTKKISSGWEYESDAYDDLNEWTEYPEVYKDIRVYTKRHLMSKRFNIDPWENANWQDLSIYYQELQVKTGDLDAGESPGQRQEIEVKMTIGLWVNAYLSAEQLEDSITGKMVEAFGTAWTDIQHPLKSFEINQLREEKRIYKTEDS